MSVLVSMLKINVHNSFWSLTIKPKISFIYTHTNKAIVKLYKLCLNISFSDLCKIFLPCLLWPFFFFYQVWDETKTGWKFISILWDSVLMQGQNVFQEGEKEIKIFQVKLLVSQQQNQMAQKDIFKEMIKTTILVYS